MKLRDKTVLVTGASRGIGAEIVRQASARGSRVGLLARTETDLDRLRGELGDGCAVAIADVLDREQVTSAVSSITQALGPVDIVVANAGVGLYGTFLEADVDDLERTMRTNYLGTVHILKATLPSMVERRHGHVVAIGSISGRIGSPFEAGYSASKFAVTGLVEGLSVELRPYNVNVSLVVPGPVQTTFFEARGHAYDRARPKPESPVKVARVALDAVEHNRAEAFVSGFMHQAVITKTLCPPIFRWGTARAFATELATMRRNALPVHD
jgi:short-subunit dehydrogenase